MANARARDVKNSTLAADIRKIRLLLLLAFATILVWLAFDSGLDRRIRPNPKKPDIAFGADDGDVHSGDRYDMAAESPEK